MSTLSAHRLGYRVTDAPLVEDASFSLEAGTLTALIGPNGAGKTTLLRLALGLLEPTSGHAMLGKRAVRELSATERARQMAYLPQIRPLVWPQPVRDVVSLGRFAYGAALGSLSSADQVAVDRAISSCRLEELKGRAADTLSGGEIARVHLARALAAETDVLVADEPIAALDPRHQHETMQLFADLAREGRTILTVIHDLDLALRYADRLIWMQNGKILADGKPEESFTPERLRAVFGMDGALSFEDGIPRLKVTGPA